VRSGLGLEEYGWRILLRLPELSEVRDTCASAEAAAELECAIERGITFNGCIEGQLLLQRRG
jgi:hypothetical protein